MNHRKPKEPRARMAKSEAEPKTPQSQPEDAEAMAEAPPPGEEEGARDDPHARLEAELADLKDQLLRALAETENVRRRAQREREDAARFAAAPLVKDIIEVADNLRRALDAVPAEAVEADEHLKTLMTGVEMTEKSLQAVLEKHHIKRLDPLGEPLDPHSHEAIFEIPDPSQPPGTIVQVVRAGYRLHDRLLRPAQVGVAKGGAAKNGNAGGSDGEREAGSRIDTSA